MFFSTAIGMCNNMFDVPVGCMFVHICVLLCFVDEISDAIGVFVL